MEAEDPRESRTTYKTLCLEGIKQPEMGQTWQMWNLSWAITEVRLACTLYALLVMHALCIDHWTCLSTLENEPSYARMRSTYCCSATN